MTRAERLELTLPVARAVVIAINKKEFIPKDKVKAMKRLAILSAIANNICKFIDESED